MSTPDRLTDEEPREALAALIRREVGWPDRQSRELADTILAARLAAQPPATDRDTEDEEATRDAIYSALHEVLACDPMWIGDDGEPLDYLPEREVLIGEAVERQTDAVLSVLAARPAPDTLADRVQALRDEWAQHGPGTEYERVFGRQVISVEFAVQQLDALLAGRSDASPEGGA